ncbi:aquaporin [Pseudaminobacter sp. NGMCC 1.201702]|uniref:aquaporin n=1 Tax=Pseudaminobacter sp. NGMCC 1.201702 TaxID=3391825 RepID=UPI0039EEE113
MTEPLFRRLAAEALGSAFLLATVVGSSIMGARLAEGSAALALLVTSMSTGSMLVVLIWTFAPISGAHLNPAVSLAFAADGQLKWRDLVPYAAAQTVGFVVGVWAAHAMYELPILQLSATARTGAGHWLAEGIATFGLIFVIIGCVARRPAVVPAAVGLYIGAAYWFTASTAFANPAMTVIRAFTGTAAGIAPQHVAGFVIAQFAGAAMAIAAGRLFWPRPTQACAAPATQPQRIPA